MAMRVNHNIAALNALRNLNKTDDDMSQTLERLSSGQKINRAADGPAALVISEQMRGQIASVNQAILNSEASVSMVQTAEAAMNEVNTLLVSMRQLAIHAANEGANDSRMLEADQAEIDNALDTIDRIARTSQFGTRTLLDGSNGANGIAVGDGLEFISAAPQTKSSPADGYAVDITRAATRAEKRGERPIELADLWDSDKQTVKDFSIEISEGGKQIGFSLANKADGGAVQKMLGDLARAPGDYDADRQLQEITRIIAQTLQRKADAAGLAIDVFLVPEQNRLGTAAAGAGIGAAAGAVAAGVNGALAGAAIGAGVGAALGSKRLILAVQHKKFGSAPTFLVAGSAKQVLATEAGKFERATPGSDVEATIDGKIASGTGIEFEGAPNTPTEGLRLRYSGVTTIQTKLPKKGGWGTSNEAKQLDELTASGGIPPGSRAIKREEVADGWIYTWEVPRDVSPDVDGYVHVSQNSLSFQVGPTRDQQVRLSLIDAKTGRLATGVKNDSGFRSLREIDVRTSQGAQDAMLLIDNATAAISAVRANLGAFQKNTLQSNTSSLRIANENLTSAESGLRDADMAEEMSHFTRNQIMLQSGVAMLAQANQTPQSVLQLLNTKSA